MNQHNPGHSSPYILVVCIVHEDDASALRSALYEAEFESTIINTSGGFLRKGNVTILMGIESWRLNRLISIIAQICHPHAEALPPPQTGTVALGAATIFILNVEAYHRV